MPPRRASRATSKAVTPGPTPRTTRGTIRTLDHTPLPTVDAEQSFAYGASHTKPLPLKLKAEKRMTLTEMAENLNAGVSKANENLAAHRQQAEDYGMSAANARAQRAQRRSLDRERASRAGSAASDTSSVLDGARTAASTTDNYTELADIQEETVQSIEKNSDDDTTDSETRASSREPTFPPDLSTSTPVRHYQADRSSMPAASLLESDYGRHRSFAAGWGNVEEPGRMQRIWNNVFAVLVWFWNLVAGAIAWCWKPLAGALASFMGWSAAAANHVSNAIATRMPADPNPFPFRFARPAIPAVNFGGFQSKVIRVLVYLTLLIAVIILVTTFGYIACGLTVDNPFIKSSSGVFSPTANWVCRAFGRDLYGLAGQPNMPKHSDYRSPGKAKELSKEIASQAKLLEEQSQKLKDLYTKHSQLAAHFKKLDASRSAEHAALAKQFRDEHAAFVRHFKDQHSALTAKIDKEHAALALRITEANDKMSFGGRSHRLGRNAPLARINYAAAGHRAIIDPHLTSPTKASSQTTTRSFFVRALGFEQRKSKTPSVILDSSDEAGECWCAAPTIHASTYKHVSNLAMKTYEKNNGPNAFESIAPINRPTSLELSVEKIRESKISNVQIGVRLRHTIVPDTISLSHAHLKTTTNPGSAPKNFEIWVDVSYMDKAEFVALAAGPNAYPIKWRPFPMVRLGQFTYDATANEDLDETYQTFDLGWQVVDEYGTKIRRADIATNKVILRVLDNWGNGEPDQTTTCVYNLGVYGEPVEPHPQIVRGVDDPEIVRDGRVVD